MRVSPRRVPLDVFRAEVAALLSTRVSPRKAASWVRRYHRYVTARWQSGSPPCKVADHLAKYEGQGLLRPRRDADNPKEGEVYESKRGDRWQVLGATPNRVDVRRAGHRADGNTYRWAKASLKYLKELSKEQERAVNIRFKADPVAQEAFRAGLEPTPKVEILSSDPKVRIEQITSRDPPSRKKGKKKDGGLVVQSITFDMRMGWKTPRAKAWLKKNGKGKGRSAKPLVEKTKNFIRLSLFRFDKKKMTVLGSRDLGHGVRMLFVRFKKAKTKKG